MFQRCADRIFLKFQPSTINNIKGEKNDRYSLLPGTE